MELVILAAGMGSRFGGLKQIEPMDEAGNFIIDYSIYDAIEAGFDSVTFIIKEELFDDFKETIGKRVEKHIKVKYAFQDLKDLPEGYVCPENRKKPWGTAHAILAVRKVVDDNFIIINADDYYGKDSFKVAAKYLKSLNNNEKGLYANVVYKVDNTLTENGSVKRGVSYANEDGFLTKMVESSIEKVENGKIIATDILTNESFEISKEQPVSMNMFIFTKDILTHLADKFPTFLDENKNNNLTCEYLIPTVVSELINEGKATVKLLPTTSKWYGVTYASDKQQVVTSFKEMVDNGLYIKGLWK